jgi:hypothetical protein
VHGLDERPELVHDGGLGIPHAAEHVEHLTGPLVHVLASEPEPLGVGEHRLVQIVDQLAAALDHLSWKRLPKRPAAPASAGGCLVHRRNDAALPEGVGTRHARQAATDDADVGESRPRPP